MLPAMTNHYLWEQKTCAYPNTVTIGLDAGHSWEFWNLFCIFPGLYWTTLQRDVAGQENNFENIRALYFEGYKWVLLKKEACRTFFAFIHLYVYNMLYNEANILYKGGNILYKGGNILYKGGNILSKGGNILYKVVNILYKGGNILYIDIEGTFKFHISNCTSFTHTWALLGCGAPWNSSTP